ncbi:MAG: class I SAM-dependent DNA methyltransferase [Microcoleus sp.]
MNEADRTRVETFITRWAGSSGNERANYQLFFAEMCDALGVDRPLDKGRIPNDPYCFDKDLKIFHPSGQVTSGFVDFYKAEHFLIEAKQGGTTSKKGTAKRGTNTYLREMEKAFVQAVAYTRSLSSKPPFLLTCDIGDHFELWMGFSGDYGGYGARREIGLAELQKADVFDLFVDIFSNPQQRNPEKIAARVTREVAADLAELAKRMEANVDPQQVAQFLMRCIFTMFAEDVGLLKEHLFTQALETRWIINPKTFKPEVEALWVAMNEGTSFGFHGQLLRFNGGLFAESQAFALTKTQLEVLLQAAKRDWCNVEPAIFGTLLERALDARERSKLGAHYTPRSYVERLVKPVVMEPLGDRWIAVQAEVKQLLNAGESEPTANQRKKAIAVLEAFLTELQGVKILDPACGSGNFLYVTLDLLKGLESEVLRRLEDVSGSAQLRLDIAQVNPSQFLGIEINPRAAAIADLVIWIGYLQWHFRRFGDIPPIEPVLREYNNIECRDAVLAYDGIEPISGKTQKATWPNADYILGNPPFIGNKRMRSTLGDSYVAILRNTWKELPETIDFVMYWWHKAAELVSSRKVKCFGFITTNSITQALNRKIVQQALESGMSILFALPDHPWVDSLDGAAVRVAMTVGGSEQIQGRLLTVQNELFGEDEVSVVELSEQRGIINPDLTVGANTVTMVSLLSNKSISFQGVIPLGEGFRLREEELDMLGLDINNLPPVVKPYMIGRDLVQQRKKKWLIDFFGLKEEEAYLQYPILYQRILETVKPLRDQNNRESRKRNWWLFGENAPKLRKSISGIKRFIVTPDTSKFKPFLFVDANLLPDVQLYSVVSDDAWVLGVLQSKIHQKWLEKVAPRMGIGNDLRWKPAIVFDPFPFPDSNPAQKQTIRELGERLDSHRKRVQATHPEVTITGMYNLLEKLRQGQPLDDKDKAFNQKALVSTLKQIHDELDAAVFAAYDWEPTLTDDQILENLVTLNAQRAEEERNGNIRWLRPDYQAPGETYIQPSLAGIITETEIAVSPTEQQPFPKTLKEQLSAIRDLFRTQSGEWTAAQVTAHFKGANRKQKVILDCLESLEDLGILLSHAENGMTFWHLAEVGSDR